MDEFILDIISLPAEVSLIVSHGGSIYLWLQRYVSQAISSKAILFGNCSIFELEYKNNSFELIRIIDSLK